MKTTTTDRYKSLFITTALFVSVSITWGTTWFAMKVAVLHIPPVLATGLRFLFAAPILIFIAKISKTPLLFPKGKRMLQLVTSIFYFAIPFSLMIYGEESVSSGMAALIFSTMPAVIAIASLAILKQGLTLKQSIGIGISSTALFAIISHESGSTEVGHISGILALLLAVNLHAIVYVLLKRYCCQVSVITFNALPSLGASVMLILYGLLFETATPNDLTPDAILSILYLGVIAGVFGIMAYFQLQKKISPFHASLVYFTFPIIALTLEAIATGHKISSFSQALIAPLLVGMFFVIKPSR